MATHGLSGGGGGAVDPDNLPCVILIIDISTGSESFKRGSLFAVKVQPNQAAIQRNPNVRAILLDSEPPDTITITGEHLRLIDTESRDLLRAIRTPEHRIRVFENPEWLPEGKDLQRGDPVLIYSRPPPLYDESQGVLCYKGELTGRKGTFFGIKLAPEHAGKGSSDGTFRKMRYFQCNEDCAIFVSIYNVRLNDASSIPRDAYREILFPPTISTSNSNPLPAASGPDMMLPPDDMMFTGSGSENSILDRIDNEVVASEKHRGNQQPQPQGPPLPSLPLPPAPHPLPNNPPQQAFPHLSENRSVHVQPQNPPSHPPPSFSLSELNRGGYSASGATGGSSNPPVISGATSEATSEARSGGDNDANLRKNQNRTSGLPRSDSGSNSSFRHNNLNLQEGPAAAASGGGDDEVPVKVGERVVWISDTGIHHGVLRWIGKPGELDEQERQVTAGVELDESAGTGTGRYQGRDLFKVKKGHAALMPIMGLVKEDDFLQRSDVAGAPSSHVTRRSPQEQEDLDLKLAMEMSMKDQNPRRKADTSFISPPVDSSIDSSFAITRPPQQQNPSSQLYKKAVPVSGATAGSSVPASLPSSNQSVNPPINPPDQPDSLIGGGVRRKNPTGRAPPQPQPATNTPMSNSNSNSLPPASLPNMSTANTLTIGSRVVVLKNRRGVIKWIGKLSETQEVTAGILMDEPDTKLYTAGVFLRKKIFDAPDHRAFFCYLHKCKLEGRPVQQQQQLQQNQKQQQPQQQVYQMAPANVGLPQTFKARSSGHSDSPQDTSLSSISSSLESMKPVPATFSPEHTGSSKGIEGVDDLSALVCLLYVWFQFSDNLDFILQRERTPADVSCFKLVRDRLRNSIIKPLRSNAFVPADAILDLFTILSTFAANFKKMDLQKTFLENYITLIVNNIFQVKLVKLINCSMEGGQDYILLNPVTTTVPSRQSFPTTQVILEEQLAYKQVKLFDLPSILHLVCKFDRLLPLLEIDLQTMVEGVAQKCFSCQSFAAWQCYGCCSSDNGFGLAQTYYCDACSTKKHSSSSSNRHQVNRLRTQAHNSSIQNCRLHLAAVICHVENQFIAFVKSNRGPNAKWMKFDPMASSVNTEEGKKYVPEVSVKEQIPHWLSPAFSKSLTGKKPVDMDDDLQLLTMHTYMCIYVRE